MRGGDVRTESLFAYVSCEWRVPRDHPLRRVLPIVDAARADLSGAFARLYAPIGRSSIPPHIAQNSSGRRSVIDRCTTRHPGYVASRRVRKRIEESFGWIKTAGGLRKTQHRGMARVGWMFSLTAAACNLARLPKLLAEA